MQQIRVLLCAFLSLVSASLAAQMNVFSNKGLFYSLPLDTLHVADERLLFTDTEGYSVRMKPSAIDSITFDEVSYQNAWMEIQTADRRDITSREEWKDCHFTMHGGTLFEDFECDGRIRGRGNSTWSWYSYGGDPLIYGRRPYKIKFNEKQAPLGMKKDKTWVLLANWRDGSFMMNAVANELGRYLDFDFTPHNRFCEVYINGTYRGLYQLCEQIQVDKHRVNIGEGDVLLSLDADDGPALSPSASDNFWSAVYRLPVCVKYPKDEALTDSAMQSIQADFNNVEALIRRGRLEEVRTRVDVRSLIDFLIVQELTFNVELDAPRSMYMYRTSDRIWHFGPLWDFDAGFSFDWSDMYRGHKYFGTQTLLFGTDPYNKPNYKDGTRFFLALFANKQFTAEFKARWNEVKGDLINNIFARLDNYHAQLAEAQERNDERWPIYLDATYDWWGDMISGERIDYKREYSKLRTWLSRRIRIMSDAINQYPE